jgi:hypothetical protein
MNKKEPWKDSVYYDHRDYLYMPAAGLAANTALFAAMEITTEGSPGYGTACLGLVSIGIMAGLYKLLEYKCKRNYENTIL